MIEIFEYFDKTFYDRQQFNIFFSGLLLKSKFLNQFNE